MLKSSLSAPTRSWRTLFLCLSLALIGTFVAARAGVDVQRGRSATSGGVASPAEQFPWTGRPLARSDVQRLLGQGDPGDRVRISPMAGGSFVFSLSLEGSLLEPPWASNSQPSLEAFRRSVMNGRADQLTGIWVEDVLAFRVQSGLTSHAPAVKDTFSIYNWAWQHGVVGLLIHNYRGGTQLYKLNPGVRIAAIYGNGGADWYVSRGGTWYESNSGSSGGFSGPFRIWSCEDCDFDASVRELHERHYAGNHRLAFQTCVYAEGRVGLVIIEAYLDWQPEPQLTDGDPMGISERYDPGLPKLYRGVVE